MKSLGDITKKFVPPEKRFDFKRNIVYNGLKKVGRYMSRKSSEKKIQYNAEYDKANYIKMTVNLKYSDNSNLIEWLNEQKEWGYSFNEIARTALWEYYKEQKNRR